MRSALLAAKKRAIFTPQILRGFSPLERNAKKIASGTCSQKIRNSVPSCQIGHREWPFANPSASYSSLFNYILCLQNTFAIGITNRVESPPALSRIPNSVAAISFRNIHLYNDCMQSLFVTATSIIMLHA
jgi:hypothetical protein